MCFVELLEIEEQITFTVVPNGAFGIGSRLLADSQVKLPIRLRTKKRLVFAWQSRKDEYVLACNTTLKSAKICPVSVQ